MGAASPGCSPSCFFAAATISDNLVEAAVALCAGGVAGSAALIGFRLDSVIEVASAAALSWLQRRAGRELGSKTAVADSKQTLLCTYLSAVLQAPHLPVLG